MNKNTTKTLSVVWLLLLALVSFNAIAEGADNAQAAEEKTPKYDKCPTSFLNKQEEEILKKLGGKGKVVRKKDSECNHVLTINTLAKTIVLTDTSSIHAFEGYKGYFYKDFYEELGYHLVLNTYLDGGEYFLISDKTGEKYTMYGRPVLSPDKKRFVSVASSELQLEANETVVWEVLPDKLVKEYLPRHKFYAMYSFSRWRDENTIELEVFRDTFKEEGYCREIIGTSHGFTGRITALETLSKEEGEWRLSTEKVLELRCY